MYSNVLYRTLLNLTSLFIETTINKRAMMALDRSPELVSRAEPFEQFW